MYLDFDTFNNLISESVKSEDFKFLLPRASVQLDNLTNGFYERNDLDTDLNSDIPAFKSRAKAFLNALAFTIDYMGANDVTSSADLNGGTGMNVQIGNTQIQGVDNAKTIASGYEGVVVPDEAVQLLARHGLIYRGMHYD